MNNIFTYHRALYRIRVAQGRHLEHAETVQEWLDALDPGVQLLREETRERERAAAAGRPWPAW